MKIIFNFWGYCRQILCITEDNVCSFMVFVSHYSFLRVFQIYYILCRAGVPYIPVPNVFFNFFLLTVLLADPG
jgi:hypothetical protein